MCKIIRSVFLYGEKPLNRSIKMQNKWNSSVKEGTFTQISWHSIAYHTIEWLFSKTFAYPVHFHIHVHHISLTTLSGSYFGPFLSLKKNNSLVLPWLTFFLHFFAAIVKFEYYLRKLNKIKICCFANKASQMILISSV